MDTNLWRISKLPYEVNFEKISKEIQLHDEFGYPIFDDKLMHNNMLIPFLVATFESYLKDLFIT